MHTDSIVKVSKSTAIFKLRKVTTIFLRRFSSSQPPVKLKYGRITETHYEPVVKLLRFSFQDEPLNIATSLCEYGKACELVEQIHMKTLKLKLSIMATDSESGEVAGVALNTVSNRGDFERGIEELKKFDNRAFQLAYGIIYECNKKLDLFNKYKVEKIFELETLSTDKKFRGMGIAKKLFVMSENLAVEEGFKLLKVDATSLFTQKIANKLGMVTVLEVRYKDYVDQEGKRPYDIGPPHEFYKIMIKKLPVNTK